MGKYFEKTALHTNTLLRAVNNKLYETASYISTLNKKVGLLENLNKLPKEQLVRSDLPSELKETSTYFDLAVKANAKVDRFLTSMLKHQPHAAQLYPYKDSILGMHTKNSEAISNFGNRYKAFRKDFSARRMLEDVSRN